MPNLNAFPFDAVQTNGVYDREYTSDDFASYFGKFIGNGIYAKNGDCLEVVADNNSMYLTVKNGAVFINGRAKDWESTQQIRLSNADGLYNRYDAVVARLNIVERDITIKVIEGTPASSPTAPNIVRNDDVYDLLLAQVLVRTGVSTIGQSDVVDKRSTSLCGFVTGLIDQIDAEAFFEQYERAFTQEFGEYQNEFVTWFDSIKNILGEDEVAVLLGEFEAFKQEIYHAVENLPQYDLMMQVKTATFTTSGWTKDSTNGYYKQTQTIEGLTALSSPVISLECSGNKDNMVNQVTEWGKILTHETGENTLTLVASSAPSMALVVSCKTTVDTDVDVIRNELRNHSHGDLYYSKDETASLVNGKAPTNHASASATYGIGTSSNYGHVRLSDSTSSSSDASSGIVATPKAVKSAYDLANSKAPTNHASGNTTYGVGTGTHYGHLKLTDAMTSTLDASSGYASTPKAVTGAYDLAESAKSSANNVTNAVKNSANMVTAHNDSVVDVASSESVTSIPLFTAPASGFYFIDFNIEYGRNTTSTEGTRFAHLSACVGKGMRVKSADNGKTMIYLSTAVYLTQGHAVSASALQTSGKTLDCHYWCRYSYIPM